MKEMVELLDEIDGYSVIRGFEECPVDPQATRMAVQGMIALNPGLAAENPETLYETYAVKSRNFLPGRKLVSEAHYETRRQMFDTIGPHQLLTEALEIIPDFRGVEYWQKTADRWDSHKIEHIGETVPAGAVLSDALTGDQRLEIAVQKEADRIAALSPQEKEAEKQNLIKAAIHEAAMKKQEAELEAAVNDTVMTFDAVAWAQAKKSEIEARYA